MPQAGGAAPPRGRDHRRPRTGPGRVQTAWLVAGLASFALLVGGLAPAPRAMVVPTASGTDVLAGQQMLADRGADPKASDTQQLAVDQTAAK